MSIAIHTTREAWLNAAAQLMAPTFEASGAPLPERYRITMSLTRRKRAIGVCYDPSASADNTFEILIRLDRFEPVEVLAILAHELTHAAVGIEAGHGPAFRRVALAIGLEGKMTATVAGEAFKRAAQAMTAALGPFPHAALNASGSGRSSGPRKQSARMLKVTCSECGYVARVSSKWLQVGPPHCPEHGEMAVAS